MAGATEDRAVSPDATPTTVIKNWMGQKTIAGFAWEEVKRANLERQNDVRHAESVLNKRGEILLVILTYAYSIGVYRSREIENELMSTPGAQRFFANAPITGRTLRHFRRCNRDLVKHCVGIVLGRDCQSKGERMAVLDEGTSEGRRSPNFSVALPVPQAVSEPEQRLGEATLCDNMESDL